MADVQGKLDEIVTMVEQAKSKALSTNQAVVPRQELLAGLEQLREQLPVEMSDARQLLRDREQIIDGAKAEGRRLLTAAHEECQRLVGEHEVLTCAEREAQEMLDYARDQSDRMRRETDEYVDSALARVQALLGSTLESVETGRERIRADQERDAGRGAFDDEAVVDLTGVRPGEPAHIVPGMGTAGATGQDALVG